MRPYQIAAAERILSRIVVSTNYKKMGTTAAGGYIWHTTGERVIIVMGAICVIKSRVSGILNKYNSCIAESD